MLGGTKNLKNNLKILLNVNFIYLIADGRKKMTVRVCKNIPKKQIIKIKNMCTFMYQILFSIKTSLVLILKIFFLIYLAKFNNQQP